MSEGITPQPQRRVRRNQCGRGRLTADNIREGPREVKRALLEADVNFNVVTDFIGRVEVKSVGRRVVTSIPPNRSSRSSTRSFTALMGPVDHKIPQQAPIGPSC